VIATEHRSLLSRLSADWQTGQLQPICGMPVEVPVPKNRIFIESFHSKKAAALQTTGSFSVFVQLTR
jgi:hypothetical protein